MLVIMALHKVAGESFSGERNKASLYLSSRSLCMTSRNARFTLSSSRQAKSLSLLHGRFATKRVARVTINVCLSSQSP